MNDERHIEENIRVAADALPGSMSEQDLALIARIQDAYAHLKKIPCTGCHYCLPCPEGVNIPACFECYNNTMFGNPMTARLQYMMFVGGGVDGTGRIGYASRCRGCNRCVPACTQHINIPQELGNVTKAMEGPGMKALGLVFRPLFGAFMRYDRWRNKKKG
jgi:predicted aldo/keto reductase-like oxidoreductase